MDDLIQEIDTYIDARIHYATCDPEWRSSGPSDTDLRVALERMVDERVRAALQSMTAAS